MSSKGAGLSNEMAYALDTAASGENGARRFTGSNERAVAIIRLQRRHMLAGGEM
jgi:hypothetical protein